MRAAIGMLPQMPRGAVRFWACPAFKYIVGTVLSDKQWSRVWRKMVKIGQSNLISIVLPSPISSKNFTNMLDGPQWRMFYSLSLFSLAIDLFGFLFLRPKSSAELYTNWWISCKAVIYHI